MIEDPPGMTARVVHIIDAACDADAVLEALLVAQGEPLLCAGPPPEWASLETVLPLESRRPGAVQAAAALRDGATARCWSISSGCACVEQRQESVGAVAVRIASPLSAYQFSQLLELQRKTRLWAVCADRTLAAGLASAGLAEAVRVIPPPAVAGEAPNRSAARERLGIGTGEFVVAACGGVHARSGHRVAVWAAAVLTVADVPIRVIVPRTGQAARAALGFAAAAGFGPQLLSAPRHTASELAEMLSAVDAALLLNTDALPPVPLAAAMRTGLPLVASDIPAAADWLENGRTALLAAPDLPRAVSQALLRVYEDRALAARLGEAARASAGDRFDPPAVRRLWDALAG